jgi:hypothetical protein
MTDPRGGYRLGEAQPFMLAGAASEEDVLDAYLREHRLRPAEAELEEG